MAATHESGPAIVYGGTLNGGPSATYQGDSLIDPRLQYKGGTTGNGQVRAFFNYAYLCMLDTIPAAPVTNLIVAAQTTPVVPGGGSLTLPLQTTLATGRAVSVPLVPFGASAAVTPGIMLEPAHTVGTTTANSTSITAVGDTALLPVGSYIAVIGGATGGVLPQIVQITASTATTLTVTPAVATAVSGASLVVMDKNGIGASSHLQSGAVALFDPHGSCARGVSVTTTAADTTFAVLVTGYDTFGVPMSESITCGSSTTVNGKKAFKFVSSVAVTKTGGGTMAGNVSVGTSDVIGMNVRGESWEYMNVFFNGAFVSANTGWVAGLATGTASTTTTADVRGTYAPATTNGSKRLAIYMSVPARQALGSSYTDASRLNGQAQA